MQEVLKDFFVDIADIERYFDGVSPVNLWRGKKKEDSGSIFGLIDEAVTRANGQIRPPDITIEILTVSNGFVVNHRHEASVPSISPILSKVTLGNITKFLKGPISH